MSAVVLVVYVVYGVVSGMVHRSIWRPVMHGRTRTAENLQQQATNQRECVPSTTTVVTLSPHHAVATNNSSSTAMGKGGRKLQETYSGSASTARLSDSVMSAAPPTVWVSAATALEMAPTASASDPAAPLVVLVLGRRPRKANGWQERVRRPLNTRRSQPRRSRVLLAAAFFVAPHPAVGEASPHLTLSSATRFTATRK